MAKKAKWRRHTLEFKRQVVERMKTCQNIHELARELGVQRKLLYTWKYQFEGRPEPRHANLGISAEDRKEKQHRDEIAKLKIGLGRQNPGKRFFSKCLAQGQGGTSAGHRNWRLSIYDVIRSRAQEQGSLGMERMCQLAGVSRASYYRNLGSSGSGRGGNGGEGGDPGSGAAAPSPLRLPDVLARHCSARGWWSIDKRVARIMREDNLLAIRYRKYILTTDSQHEHEVYLNLAARMTVTAVNQLWVADITYIRLRVEFVYLAVVIDRFSRKVIGWALDHTLQARVAVAALRQADRPTPAAARCSPSLRPGYPVRLHRLCRGTQGPWDGPEHEPAG